MSNLIFVKIEKAVTTDDLLVPKEGLEPSHLAAHAPETCASTNSATSVVVAS